MSALVDIWWGNGFLMETRVDGDGYYNLVLKSPDVRDRETVDSMAAWFREAVTGVRRG